MLNFILVLKKFTYVYFKKLALCLKINLKTIIFYNCFLYFLLSLIKALKQNNLLIQFNLLLNFFKLKHLFKKKCDTKRK